MNETKNHSAAGAFLGFLFQIERVLIWLSDADSGGFIGLETNDDIEVRLNSGENIHTIYEQAKNAQGGNIPFSDFSVDLWKTLSIWTDAIQTGTIDLTKSNFSAITNKTLPKDRLIVKIGKAENEEDCIACLNILKDIGPRTNKQVQPYSSKVASCSDQLLTDLIKKVIVLDGSYHHNSVDLKKTLKNNLRIGAEVRFNHVYERLVGYITNLAITNWRKKQEVWISVDAFRKTFNNIVAEDLNKPFIERTIDSLPNFSKKQIDSERGALFVKQLMSIDCDEQDVYDAINDFLRAGIQKHWHTVEGEVLEDKYDAYHDDLYNYWKSVAKPRFRNNPNNQSKEDIGYEVYHNTIIYKGKLSGQTPEQGFTHRGAFHYLANEPRLGWRSDWEKLFKKKKNGSK